MMNANVQEQTIQKNNDSKRTAKGNLEYNIASVLCYTPFTLINVIASVLWLKTEPRENRQLRFHAIQSLALVIVAIALGCANMMLMRSAYLFLGYGILPLLGSVHGLLGLAFFAVNVYGMYCVFQGKEFRIPMLCDFADKHA